MSALLDSAIRLWAAAPPAPAPRGAEMWTTMLPLLIVFMLFYFLMMRPQQKQEQKRRQMIDALKTNDEVLTSSGIYGTVVRIEPEKNRLVLRCNETKLTFTRSSVIDVLKSSEKDKKSSDLSE